MPFLRVLRDKRGYETTYLMHWFRDGGRQRSRILYAFRTPPGVRVGREPLDPAVVRELQAQHPDIEFDWRALFDNRQMIETSAEPRRAARQKSTGRAEPVDTRKRRTEKDEREETPEAATAPAADAAPAAGSPAKSQVPAVIQGETREQQLAFLAAWYPELRDRLPHRTQDPIRREALLALIERLNAAGWETEEQITAGLQVAAEALQRLSRVFANRRRRPRRSKPAVPETRAANGAS